MNNYNKIMIISGDIFYVIKCMEEKGWGPIKESSINRIIYLSAVMYSFMVENSKNIFEDDYNFSVTISGPTDANISRALTNLQSNDAVILEPSGYKTISKNYGSSLLGEYALEKHEWIDTISYIIGIYGEDKIYDFVFRDPQYQNSIKSNSLIPLNLDKDNATVLFLSQFKTDFEQQVSLDQKLNNRQYLELYFEYVFGKIIRGDV